MTQKRDLGPLLALAGGAIAIAAVIAGFVVVGGPGDTRDRRLDERTKSAVGIAFNIVQCAFNGSGAAPATIDAAMRSEGWTSKPENRTSCATLELEEQHIVSSGHPSRSDQVSYEALSPTRVRICAFFKRPDEGRDCPGCYVGDSYDGLFAARSAGLHCYEIEMVAQPVVGRSGVYFPPYKIISH